MAKVVDPTVFGELTELAAPLIEAAITAAPGLTFIDEDADEVSRITSLKVTALVIAFDALLAVLEPDELTMILALGTVGGTQIAQCRSDRRKVLGAFEAQMSRSLAEVTRAITPQGNA